MSATIAANAARLSENSWRTVQLSHLCQDSQGQPIVFRMIQGRCIPMHPEGGCSGHRSETEGEKKPDCLYLTDCPKCGDPVYFLRHNSGSTWLDEIPYPWPKHACFLDESAPVPPPWVG